jgi:hypothetical protein
LNIFFASFASFAVKYYTRTRIGITVWKAVQESDDGNLSLLDGDIASIASLVGLNEP